MDPNQNHEALLSLDNEKFSEEIRKLDVDHILSLAASSPDALARVKQAAITVDLMIFLDHSAVVKITIPKDHRLISWRFVPKAQKEEGVEVGIGGKKFNIIKKFDDLSEDYMYTTVTQHTIVELKSAVAELAKVFNLNVGYIHIEEHFVQELHELLDWSVMVEPIERLSVRTEIEDPTPMLIHLIENSNVKQLNVNTAWDVEPSNSFLQNKRYRQLNIAGTRWIKPRHIFGFKADHIRLYYWTPENFHAFVCDYLKAWFNTSRNAPTTIQMHALPFQPDIQVILEGFRHQTPVYSERELEFLKKLTSNWFGHQDGVEIVRADGKKMRALFFGFEALQGEGVYEHPATFTFYLYSGLPCQCFPNCPP